MIVFFGLVKLGEKGVSRRWGRGFPAVVPGVLRR